MNEELLPCSQLFGSRGQIFIRTVCFLTRCALLALRINSSSEIHDSKWLMLIFEHKTCDELNTPVLNKLFSNPYSEYLSVKY
jgi:hypothetical protein